MRQALPACETKTVDLTHLPHRPVHGILVSRARHCAQLLRPYQSEEDSPGYNNYLPGPGFREPRWWESALLYGDPNKVPQVSEHSWPGRQCPSPSVLDKEYRGAQNSTFADLLKAL